MNIIRLQGDTEKRKGIYYEYDADGIPLGEGGMGRVFKGFRVVERTGERKPVAIKAIYENIPERVVERARREAEIQLDNDNLIRMYGFVEAVSHFENGMKRKVHYHVIMELLVGVTLEDLMNGITNDKAGMQIPFAAELYSQYIQHREAAVVRIMKSILSGLMALHDKGYIHRDIDPSNIMITADKKIKLIDFGICKQIVSLESLDKALTVTGAFMGKVNYAAPELVLGDVKNQNYTTDIYALGILLYQLCAGHLPFSGTDQDILSANIHTNLPMKDIHSRDIRKIIRKATEKTQSKRYSTVAEMRVDMERVDTTGGDDGNMKKYIISGIAAAFAVIGGCIYMLLWRGDGETVESVVYPTCQELYSEAIYMLNQADSLHLQVKGKDILRVLAEDSLYNPAKETYYLMLINSKNAAELRKGFEELQKDTTGFDALYECGFTLSVGNEAITDESPTERQVALGIEPDVERANHLLLKAIKADTTDYKSVYWALNNSISYKINNKLSRKAQTQLDEQLVYLYKMFDYRSDRVDDASAEPYIEDFEDYIHTTLYNWGLIN